jgi:hypothetical protein
MAFSPEATGGEEDPSEWTNGIPSRRAVMAAIAGTGAGCIAGESPTDGGTTGGGGTSSSSGGGPSGCAPAAYDGQGGRTATVNECPMADHPRHEGPMWAMAWAAPEQEATSKSDEVEDLKLYTKHKPNNPSVEKGDLIYDFNGIREELDYISFASAGGTRAWGYPNGSGGMLNLAETTSLDNPVYKGTVNGDSRNWDSALDQDETILRNAEPGRRGFQTFSWFNHFRGQPRQRPEADPRDGPIITTLAEDLNGEKTSQIEVEPCNFGIPNNTPFNRDQNNYGYLVTPRNHDLPVKKPRGNWDIPFEESNVSFATMNTKIEEGVTTIEVGTLGSDGQKGARLWGETGDPVYYGNKSSAWKYHGVQMAAWVVDKHFGALKERIGEDALDYLFLDWEHGLAGPFGMSKQDPRYTDPKHGFGGKSMQELEEEKGAGFVKAAAEDWNLHAGIFTPAKKHFPDLKGSNYGSSGVPEENPLGRVHPTVFGTHGSAPRYPGESHPRKSMLRIKQITRNQWVATKGRWMPWIGWKSWTGDHAFPHPVGNNFYYDEMVRQEALHEPDPILYFWLPGAGGGTGPEDDKALDATLAEVNDQLGGGYSLLTHPEVEGVETGGTPEVTAEGLEDSGSDLVTGVKLADGGSLWRLTCRRFGFTDNTQPMPDDSPPIDVTIADGDGNEIETVTIEGGTPGTWWTYDEATTDLTFTLDYPVDQLKK